MRVLVIPDVHLKSWMFDLVDMVTPDAYDRIISVGDWVDEWGQEANSMLYERCLNRLYLFAKDHPTALFCYGNHDISYMYLLEESGFSYRQIPLIQKYYAMFRDEFKKRFMVATVQDDVVFSHAGFSDYWVMDILSDIIGSVDNLTIEDIVKCTNNILKGRKREKIWDLWNDASPIWVRPQDGDIRLYDPEHVFQVFGHTPTREIVKTDHWVSCDTFSTTRNAKDFIGDCDLIIIDTVTHAITSVRNDIIGKEQYDGLINKLSSDHQEFLMDGVR